VTADEGDKTKKHPNHQSEGRPERGTTLPWHAIVPNLYRGR